MCNETKSSIRLCYIEKEDKNKNNIKIELKRFHPNPICHYCVACNFFFLINRNVLGLEVHGTQYTRFGI